MATSYSDALAALRGAGLDTEPAEVHGFAAALLVPDEQVGWERLAGELFALADGDDGNTARCLQLFRELYDDWWRGLADSEFGLQLFLPGDDADLRDRVQALADWVQGYLFGLGVEGIPGRIELSAESQEALGHLLEIARVDPLAAEGGDEEDLMQLTEFVKVAVIMVREDLSRGGVVEPE